MNFFRSSPSMSIRLLIGWCLGMGTGASPAACQNNGLTPVLSVSYTADSVFTVSQTNIPSSCYCAYAITMWNGQVISPASLSNASCGAASVTFSTSGGNLSPIMFGETFVFRVDAFSDSQYTIQIGSAAESQIVPPLCVGPNYSLTSVNLVKRPFGVMDASVTNRPLSGQCVYYLTQWAGSPSTDQQLSTQCGTVSFNPASFVFGSLYAVQMMVFSQGANIATAQPLCGAPLKSSTPSQCASPLVVADSGYGALTVTQPAPAAINTKCEVYLSTWNGVSVTSLKVTKSSQSCSPVTFRAMDAGYAFQYGLNSYVFEYAEYPSSTINTYSYNPTCSGGEVSTVFPIPTCNAAVDLLLVQTDPSGVRITIPSGKPYGACRVTLVTYNSVSVSVPRVGACSESFFFTSDGSGITFAASDSVAFKYEFFANGDVTSSTTCVTSPNNLLTSTIGQYSCGNAMQATESAGNNIFSIASPTPQTGVCKLKLENCGAGSNSNQINFPSCASSLTLTYSQIATIVPQFLPGESCQVSWEYYVGSTLYCSSISPVTQAFLLPVSASQGAASSTQLNLMVGTLPSPLAVSATVYCYASLVSCDGTTPQSAMTQVFTPCQSGSTASFPVDGQIVKTGSNCIVQVFVKNAQSDQNAGAASGLLSFSVADVPSWDAAQQPVVTLYGATCMQITWPAVAYSNGAPVLCYEVQRKDGSGSFYVIETCAQNQVAGNTSTITCGFSQNVPYTFQVIAINRVGRSANGVCQSDPTHLEWLQSAPSTVFLTPDNSTTSFQAGAFPLIALQAYSPTSPSATIDANTTGRLFVATLVNRCKLDSSTLTITVPLAVTDPGYVTVLPLSSNSPPAFTDTFHPVTGSLGQYSLLVSTQPSAGAFSLVVYSLETGGLLGQYWTNIIFSGAPVSTTKDPAVNFTWTGFTPIINTPATQAYDMVGIRWTGFLEAAYSELYTFVVRSYDPIRVWIDDVMVINFWYPFNCGGYCSGQATLQQSTLSDREFSRIRIDYFHSSSVTSIAEIELQWSSFSQALEVIPTQALFKATVVSSAVRTLTVTPASLSPPHCEVSSPGSTLVAGQTYSITVTAKDEFGNTLDDFNSAFTATFQGTQTEVFTSVPSSTPGIYTIAFSLSTAGSYSLSLQDAVSQTSLSFSGNVIVTFGAAYSVSAISVSTAAPTAGIPIVVHLSVRDMNANLVSGSADVFLSASWSSDPNGQARLPYADDDAIRAEKYGTVFTTSQVTWNGVQFQAVLTLSRAGYYTVQAGVSGGASPLVLSPDLSVVPNTIAVGINSVVVSQPFPPSQLVVGQESSFTLQLRDAYMNPMLANPAVSPTVAIRLQNQGADVACTSAATLGTYTCSVTPSASGAALGLAMLVNNFFAGYLYLQNGAVATSIGPWIVAVEPGAADASHSFLTGVRTVYMAGLAAPAILYLRDQFGNALSNVASWPSISASLSSGGTVTDSMDPATFTFIAQDASVTIPILATAYGTGLVLTVTVDGQSVPLPYGITTVSVMEGLLSAIGSACAQVSNSIIAGTAGEVACVPKDSQGNSVIWPNMIMRSRYSHTTNTLVSSVAVQGLSANGQTPWSTSTTSLTAAGDYSLVVSIAQPGGFMAKYFADSSFSTLIGIGGVPLASQQSPSEPPVYYTKIDGYVNFNIPGPYEVESLSVDSAIWTGLILAPATATFSFNLTASGGVIVTIGASVTDLSSATSVDTQIDVDLVQDEYTEVEIQFVPGATFQISLSWSYPGSIPSTSFVVPAINVYSRLTNQVTSLTVTPSDVSSQSFATFSPNPIAGEADFIVVYPMDQYSNPIASPACLTGSGASCFFQVTIPISDGSTINNNGAVQLADGSIQIPIQFGTDGQIDVQISLKTGVDAGGSLLSVPLAGSPFTVSVAASQAR